MYIDISISPTQGVMLFFSAPLIRSANLSANAKWIQNGVTIAGGNEYDNGMNQLYNPWGLCVDDNQTIYIADASNHRIVEWKYGATAGRVVTGGNGEGNRSNQFNSLIDAIIDKEKDSFIICDYGNKRIVRWSGQDGTIGEAIVSKGSVDRDHSLFVSDTSNHRVMKWMEGEKQGIIVAGGQGQGNSLTQLSYPRGVIVNQSGIVYVADSGNNRIMCWPQGATRGSIIIGGNGYGNQSNKLSGPIGLSFDREGNLYVSENGNHRVQKFNIDQS
ncbi:unnamed protein product [Rotaria sp. Silwood1]|nr:unnamed protein product [Rotaria sp. Silwood1]CAF3671701.1 unnamed protein product [Rotaria sp. Silwood1]CAF3786962.1 unnamed protein product [Rotaria sp. Silwood1]CAF4807201.1 unnamed protein product [Rotaria sp. Silwood1]